MSTRFCILPTEAIQSLSTRNDPQVSFLRLPHPRTGMPALFLPVETGDQSGVVTSQILELQAVNPVDSRSWFLENEVVSDGKLMLMTPVDPVFLLIPILLCIQPTDGSLSQFKPADDMLEEAALAVQDRNQSRKDGHVSSGDVLQFTSLRCSRNALKHICDVKEITEEITVYRYSQDRTLEYLFKKVSRLSEPKTLEASNTITRNLAKDGLMEDGNEELLKSGQLKAACDLISHYLSPEIRSLLYASHNFTKLEDHLKIIAAEATVSNPVPPTNKKVKVPPEEKKRKAAKESHGVKALKKANVSGMGKITGFLKKQPVDKVPS